MKSKIFIGSAALLSAVAIAWAAKDPVVMRINGEAVPKSEFEYLYHKNSQQQLEAQPLEEYVGMFELYKMKVADAKAEGIDTTAAFLSEMAQYRRDLAAPYVADSAYINSLVDEAYDHSLQEVDYYHIMLPKPRNAEEKVTIEARADSIRTALVNGADFEALAREYSTDRASKNRGGHLGYIAAGRLPYSFEHAAYALTPGQISDVVETGAGYHVIKVGGRRPAKGSVKASHIMKQVRPGMSPEQEAMVKAQIDSLYKIVKENPDIFEQTAMTNSDDQGSARMGGLVGWFTTGMMVPEFSEKAFEIEVGEISEPVRSNFGWHIIKKLDASPVRGKEALKPELLTQFNDPRDERFKMIRANRDRNLERKHKVKVNDAVKNGIKGYVDANGLDSLFYVTYGSNTEPLFTIDGTPTTVETFVTKFKEQTLPDPYIAGLVLDERYAVAFDDALMDAEEAWLYANDADYRNLMNEYRDGSLLYEVSLRKVWDKASQDTAGLEKYFNEHRNEYTFKQPRVKGYLIQAKNDSVGEAIKARYAELGKDTALQTLRTEFRNEAIVDRLLAGEGVNRFVDYLFFNGPEPDVTPKYPVFFIIEGRLINEPEEMADVKGAVTSDYQQLLEQNWTTELRRKYPVVRYDDELKKVK